MTRVIVYVALVAAAIVTLIFIPPDAAITVSVVTGFATGAAIPLIEQILASSNTIKILIRTKIRHNQLVRVSISYLLRIRIDDRYLLIRGGRYRSQAQPVGGVYKYSPSIDGFLRELSAVDDELIPVDTTSKNDLRLRLPGKNVVKLLRWFEAGRKREAGFWREFYEELIEPGYLPASEFPYVHGGFVQRKRLFRYSEFARCYELLIADVIEIELTPTQQDAVRAAVGKHPEMIFLFTADQITRRGATPGSASQELDIPQTALWTLQNK